MMLEFNELGDYWTDRLQMHAGNGDVINMDEMISKLTLDGIGKVAEKYINEFVLNLMICG